MSMMRECIQFKATDGKWYMHLAEREYGDIDDCTTYGPFDNREAISEFLHRYFANPGGMSVYEDGTEEVPIISPNGQPIVKPGSLRSGW